MTGQHSYVLITLSEKQTYHTSFWTKYRLKNSCLCTVCPIKLASALLLVINFKFQRSLPLTALVINEQ